MPDVPKKKDLVIMRVFDAPVAAVWKAWTDPEQVKLWWGPDHFTCPSAKIDFREGGTSLVCMRAPKEFGGQDMFSTWAYTKISPMTSFEYIPNLADKDGKKTDPVKLGLPADFPMDQRHKVAFKDLGNGKTPAQVLSDFQTFVSRVRARLPRVRIDYIAIKPSKARWHLFDKIKIY